MIKAEYTIKVTIDDEMIDLLHSTLKGLDELQSILVVHGLSFRIPGSDWFDYADLYKARDLLATLANPECYFEE